MSGASAATGDARRALRVLVIIASTRDGRFGPTIADWFLGHGRRRRDMEFDVVDLAHAELPLVLTEARPAGVQVLGKQLADADAFVVVTPEYNSSFPASLKLAIDWFYDEWAGKPVTFVAYGRESGGQLAVAQLRGVFAECNAVTIRNIVQLPCYWERFAPDGSWPAPDSALDQHVAEVLDQLAWWGHALETARNTTTFVA